MGKADNLKKIFMKYNIKDILGNIYFYVILSIISFVLFFFFPKDDIFKTIGTILLTSSIFKFLLTGNDFLNIISDELRKILLYDKDYIFSNFTLEKKEKIASDLYNSIEKEKRKIAIEKSKEVYYKNKSNNNFIVLESFRTVTLYLNSNTIITFRIVAEIMEDGQFLFKYSFETDNKNRILPSFNEFLNKDRFNDFSFEYKLLTYESSNNKKERINWGIIKDHDYQKEIKFYINNTKKGDIIDFMFSITIVNEYTKEVIQKIKDEKNHHFTSSKTLHAIRNVNFQIENYNNSKQSNIDLEPSLFCEKNNLLKPIEKKEDIYYKRYKWKIYSFTDNCKNIIIGVN